MSQELALLATALIQRAVRDLQSRGHHARDAWAWLMLPAPDDAADGWTLEDACLMLGADPACLRRALVARGYRFPPTPSAPRGQGRVRVPRPGWIHCRTCGVPVPTPDRRVTRTCCACGTRLQPYYLCRQGLLSPEYRTTKAPQCTRAAAAMTLLLHEGPLPGRYLHDQLGRAGFTPWTIQRAREHLRPIIARSRDGFTIWALRPA